MNQYKNAFPYFHKNDIPKILEQIKEILLGNKMLTIGEHVNKFEQEFGKYCGAKYAIATNSGTSALEICLSCLNLSNQDEVIVPVQTCIATGSCVLKSGAKIIFCDIDDNFILDFINLKKLINKNTKAVIVVHFAGMISKNILKIRDYLKQKNIILIEDCAHAHGASFEHIKAGNISDFGCFSFCSTKMMTTGEGGMITTNNKYFFEKCASITNRGIDINNKNESFINIGSNHRLSDIQALLGRYQLKRLNEFIKHRNKIASIYINELQSLISDKTIRLQKPSHSSIHVYWRFIVFLQKHNRNEIIKHLNKLHIQANAPYFPLLHQHRIFDNTLKQQTPNAHRLLSSHISLLIHMHILQEDAQFIAKTLIKILKKQFHSIQDTRGGGGIISHHLKSMRFYYLIKNDFKQYTPIGNLIIIFTQDYLASKRKNIKNFNSVLSLCWNE